MRPPSSSVYAAASAADVSTAVHHLCGDAVGPYVLGAVRTGRDRAEHRRESSSAVAHAEERSRRLLDVLPAPMEDRRKGRGHAVRGGGQVSERPSRRPRWSLRGASIDRAGLLEAHQRRHIARRLHAQDLWTAPPELLRPDKARRRTRLPK